MAAVTGLLLLKKYKFTAAKFFIFFIFYLVFCDCFGLYANYTSKDGFLEFLEGTPLEKNYWWTTLTWFIGAILFFVFYYHRILKSKRDKKIIKYSGISFLFISILYIGFHFQDFFVRFFPIISVLGAVVILLCVILYFIEILQSEKVLTFYKSLNFYISSSILIWWLIITPLVFYDIYFSTSDWDFVFLKWQIYLFANIFMYTTFTVGLIVSKTDKGQAIKK